MKNQSSAAIPVVKHTAARWILLLALGAALPHPALATNGFDTQPDSSGNSDMFFSLNGTKVGDWSANQLSIIGGLSTSSSIVAGTGATGGSVSAATSLNVGLSGTPAVYFTSSGTGALSSSLTIGGGITLNGSSASTISNGLTVNNGLTAATINGSTNITGNLTVGSNVSSGNTASVTSGAYYHNSDARLKTDIHPITGALDKILALHGVEFTWKAGGRPDMGVVAQNVADVFPHVVKTNENGMMSVEYDSLVGPMIEAMRELKSENDTLRAKVADMDKMQAQLIEIKQTLQDMKHDDARIQSIRLDDGIKSRDALSH